MSFFFWLLQRLTLTSERSNTFSGCYLIRFVLSHILLVDGAEHDSDTTRCLHTHRDVRVFWGSVYSFFLLPNCTMMQLVAPGRTVWSACCTLPYLLFFLFHHRITPCSFSGKTTTAGVVCAPRTGDSRFALLIDRLFTLLIGCIRDASALCNWKSPAVGINPSLDITVGKREHKVGKVRHLDLSAEITGTPM